LGALERLFIEQNSKNKKNQQRQFFFKNFFGFDDEVELLKVQFFFKSKKITIEQQLHI
jgi:hypothetical protein